MPSRSQNSKPDDRRAADYFAWKRALWSDRQLAKLAGVRGARDIRATACALTDVFGHWGQECRPSIPTLAAMLGCHPTAVRRHLQKLVAGGWLADQKVPGCPTIYSIVNPYPLDSRGTGRTPTPQGVGDTNERLSNGLRVQVARLSRLPRSAARELHAGPGETAVIEGFTHWLRFRRNEGTPIGCCTCRILWAEP